MFEKILFIGAWVFGVIGLISLILGIILQNDYNDSLEEKIDAMKGIKKSYRHLIRFGFWAFLVSLIIIIANYV